jgi:hypothetical protein
MKLAATHIAAVPIPMVQAILEGYGRYAASGTARACASI